MTVVNPYITFKGNCEEAFEFYRSVFGGEFATVMRMGDVEGMPIPEAEKDKIMHVALPISDGSTLMGSDAMDGQGPPVTVGDNVGIAIGAKGKEESDRLFNGLSAGGTVKMPMADAFWGGYFGMFTDKFGINWMINGEK